MADFISRSTVARAVATTLGLMAAAGALAQTSGQANVGEPADALPAVTVHGQREALGGAPAPYAGGQVSTGARLGILGNTSVLDTPFNVTAYTAQTIRNEQARSVADVIAVDPSVRLASARSNINEDFTIRGFSVPSSDFALNGVFGLTSYWRAPLEAVEQVDILKGPSAALFGMTPGGSIGGVVNLVPKRAADEPLTRLNVSAMSDSVLGTHLDFGRRFGPNKALGARVNVMHREGDTTVNSQSARESLGSLALDLRERSFRASLDLLWQTQRINNVVRQFQLDPGLIAIPGVPENSTAYPGLGYSDGEDLSVLLKAEYDLNNRATAFVSVGQRKLVWDAFAANPNILNAAGDYEFFGGWQKMNVDSKPIQLGVRGRFLTGAVEHKATLSYDRLDQTQTLGFYTGFPAGASNLYTGQLFATPPTAGINNPLRPYLDTKLTSLALADTLSMMDETLLVTLGARRQQVEAQNYDFTTGVASGPYYDQSEITPLVGVVYKLSPQWSLYASYVEGLSKGDTAPISGALGNPGAMLPPYRSKQKEIGTKWNQGTFMTTLSLFEITKPSAAISNNTFAVNGEKRNRGVEGNVAGEVTTGLRLLGGLSYIDAVLTKSADASIIGKGAIGVPKLQANLGAEWDLRALPGLTLSGRAIHTGKAYANQSNTLETKEWTRFDAGARYSTRLAAKPVTFRLNVENLTDKNYYGIATEGYLFLGTPRTVTLSASVDL